ncbi:cytospin-A isoform X2 [Lampetra planeri]
MKKTSRPPSAAAPPSGPTKGPPHGSAGGNVERAPAPSHGHGGVKAAKASAGSSGMSGLTKSQSRDDLLGGSSSSVAAQGCAAPARKHSVPSASVTDQKAKATTGMSTAAKRAAASKDSASASRDKAKDRLRQGTSKKSSSGPASSSSSSGPSTSEHVASRRPSRSRLTDAGDATRPGGGGRTRTAATDGHVQGGSGEQAALEARVKALLALAESKDSEIGQLKGQLRAMKAQLGMEEELEAEPEPEVEVEAEVEAEVEPEPTQAPAAQGISCDVEAALGQLMEQNRAIRGELSQLKSENRMLKDRLNALGFSLEQQQHLQQHHSERLQSLGMCGGIDPLPASASSREGSSRGSLEDLLSQDGSSCCTLGESQPLSNSVDNLDSESSELPPYGGATSSDDALDASSESEGGPTPAPDVERDPEPELELRPECGQPRVVQAVGKAGVGGATGTSEVSVACLTEKIHQMEENQHSTSEELQATLQELQDLQQVAQELSNENERLSEERALLLESLCQQGERLDELSRQADCYRAMLAQDGGAMPPLQAGDMGACGGAAGDALGLKSDGRVQELERGYLQLAESAQIEQEQLLGVQQRLTAALHAAENEHAEAESIIQNLKERNRHLERLLEAEQKSKALLAASLEDYQAAVTSGKQESARLKGHLDEERRRLAELYSLHNAGEDLDLCVLLDSARADKERLESMCANVQEELEHSQAEGHKLQTEIEKLSEELNEEKRQCSEMARTLDKLRGELEEKETEIADMKETIFELEDEVEQHRALKLHDNLIISELEGTVRKLQDQTHDYEREIKILRRKLRDESEEWRQFQTDLQMAVVIANEIKAEAQEEIDELKRQLQEEQERNHKLSMECEELKNRRHEGHHKRTTQWASMKKQEEEHQQQAQQQQSRMFKFSPAVERDLAALRQSVVSSRKSSLAAEPSPTVKTLIKSFNSASQVSRGAASAVPTSPRTPLSPSPVKMPPAAAVSPMQRHSIAGPGSPAAKPISALTDKRPSFGDLSTTGDLIMRAAASRGTTGLGRASALDSAGVLRRGPDESGRDLMVTDGTSPSPSATLPPGASVSPKLSLPGGSATMSVSPTPRSRISEERKDPLGALAREYGGSKRNALLKWCQKKTEGYQNIDITNFSSSWNDGLAFCALLHTYLPAHIPYAELCSQDKKRNLTLAFQAAESVGIKPTLDINDMVHTERPDWQSVMHYVTAIYKYFET